MPLTVETFDRTVAQAIVHLRDADPVMERIIDAVGPCALMPGWHRSPFECLIRAVAHQQLQGKAAEAILQRFIALFAPAPFPTPTAVHATTDPVLRGTGLSRNKIAAIRAIAEMTDAGVVPNRSAAEALDDTELIRRLIAIRGVGQWTVEMVLIFGLGRLDVFPVGDFGIRNGMRAALGFSDLPAKPDMLQAAEPWRPYRSIASWYLWRVAERAGRTVPGGQRQARLSAAGRAEAT
jgi:DNA-3-methyladenine glycosylase II